MKFKEAIKARRSQYGLTDSIKVEEKDIVEMVEDALLHAPSPYNIQPTRAVVLFGENHEKLWEITKEKLLEKIGPERFVDTEKKINEQFLSGYGSILFFLDEDLVKEHAEKMSENFYTWSDQSAGMVQYAVWTGLASMGIGASLQHYNPLIDDDVKEAFDIDKGLKLISQMPFGDVETSPKEKKFKEIEELVQVRR